MLLHSSLELFSYSKNLFLKTKQNKETKTKSKVVSLSCLCSRERACLTAALVLQTPGLLSRAIAHARQSTLLEQQLGEGDLEKNTRTYEYQETNMARQDEARMPSMRCVFHLRFLSHGCIFSF